MAEAVRPADAAALKGPRYVREDLAFMSTMPAWCRAPRTRATLVACATIVLLDPLRARTAEVSLVEILERTGAYVRALEHTFVTVICDEAYEQHVNRQGYGFNNPGPGQPKPVSDRYMHSEMLFTWVPEQRAWMSVRNVLEVDGEPVPDSRERLARALRGEAQAGMPRLRQMLEESARFNIGPVPRNIGDPTLALAFLDPIYQPRFTFTVAGRERIDGAAVLKLAFTERARPTIVADDRGDVVSRGFVWVRSDDGAVVRTNLKLSIEKPTPLRASITVDYERDAKLNLLVPVHMKEAYVLTYRVMNFGGSSRRSGMLDVTTRTISQSITCMARYTNFRRFETSGRIVMPD